MKAFILTVTWFSVFICIIGGIAFLQAGLRFRLYEKLSEKVIYCTIGVMLLVAAVLVIAICAR